MDTQRLGWNGQYTNGADRTRHFAVYADAASGFRVPATAASTALRMAAARSSRGSFGIDAPPVIVAFAGLGLIGLIVVVLSSVGALDVLGLGIALVAVGAFTTVAMLHSSLRGKLKVRDRVLDRLDLRERADILDLGCGSGLMLLGAAARVAKGTATGLDLWRTRDQTGSSPERCLANARALGVADRVRLITGDMSDVPLDDASVDVVLACLSIHNVHDRSRRKATIAEAARVLRPGGQLAIVDFARTREYVAAAQAEGLLEGRRSRPSLRMYPPTRVVTARAPQTA